MKKKLATEDLVQLATPIYDGLPLKLCSRTELKKNLNQILERISVEPRTICGDGGVPLAVVYDWRHFKDLEQRRRKLTSILDSSDYPPRAMRRNVGPKLDEIVKGESFQELCRACEKSQLLEKQMTLIKARLYDEQERLGELKRESSALKEQLAVKLNKLNRG